MAGANIRIRRRGRNGTIGSFRYVYIDAIFTPPFYRSRLIGIFLAILEMIKGRELWLEQPEPFGEIWLSLRVEESPDSEPDAQRG